MPKLPNVTPKQLGHFYKAEGFVLDSSRGSHHIFYHPRTKQRVVIPMHTKDMPKGTLAAILRQSGYTHEQLSSFMSKA